MTAHTGPSRRDRGPASPLYKPLQRVVDAKVHQLEWRGAGPEGARWKCSCGDLVVAPVFSGEDGGEAVALQNHVAALEVDRRDESTRSAIWTCYVCGERILLATKPDHMRMRHR